MLVVLTLLVVSANRFGNINLKIAGNAQTEAEASAAAQVAIEKMLKEVNAASKVDTVAAQPAMAVSTGGATYTVNAAKPVCVLSRNVVNTELDSTSAKDRLCYGGGGVDPIYDANGKPIAQPTECKSQQWELSATLNDTASGANVKMLQGVSLRVPAEVACP